jgi:ribose transport system permease protein
MVTERDDAATAPRARPFGTAGVAGLLLRVLRTYGLVIALAIMLVTLSVTAEHFLTLSNIMNILLQSANIGIMAAGLTVVIIASEIDLSVASLQTLGAVVVALLLVNYQVPIVPAILLALMVGVTAGAFSGFFTGWFSIPAFILTLAMDSLARGASLIFTQSTSIYGLPDAFSVIGQGYVGPVPVAALIMAVVFIAVHLLLTRTVLGTNIYAVGGNKEAARVAGINVFAVKLVVLTISGFCGALAGIVMASRLMAAQPIMGLFDLMDVIAAVVIGGTSLLGGEGRIIGTVIGTFIIASMRNGLNLLGISPDWQLIAVGTIIVLAVLVDYVGRKRSA